jgi:hypothetical protein
VFTTTKTRNNTYAFLKNQDPEKFINTVEIKKNNDVEGEESDEDVMSKSISNLSLKSELIVNAVDMLETNNELASKAAIQRQKIIEQNEKVIEQNSAVLRCLMTLIETKNFKDINNTNTRTLSEIGEQLIKSSGYLSNENLNEIEEPTQVPTLHQTVSSITITPIPKNQDAAKLTSSSLVSKSQKKEAHVEISNFNNKKQSTQATSSSLVSKSQKKEAHVEISNFNNKKQSTQANSSSLVSNSLNKVIHGEISNSNKKLPTLAAFKKKYDVEFKNLIPRESQKLTVTQLKKIHPNELKKLDSMFWIF